MKKFSAFVFLSCLSLAACESEGPAPVVRMGMGGPDAFWTVERLSAPMPSSYMVRPYDTVASVAHTFNVPPEQLASFNGVTGRLQVGQTLRIPPPVVQQASAVPAVNETVPAVNRTYAPVTRVASGIEQQVLAPPVGSSASRVTAEPLAPAQPSPLTQATAPVSVPAFRPLDKLALNDPYTLSGAPSSFAWPVNGHVISGYGPKEGGLYNDGINIAVPKGTPVKAAADGTVAYVGHAVESYGNLVLIRHGGGLVTAYAHLSAVTVKQGMAVHKGQAIGAVGSTGAVASSQLHFEIRRGTGTVDPAQYL